MLALGLGPTLLRTVIFRGTQTQVIVVGDELVVFHGPEIIAGVLHLAGGVFPLIAEINIRDALNHLNTGALRQALHNRTIESHGRNEELNCTGINYTL